MKTTNKIMTIFFILFFTVNVNAEEDDCYKRGYVIFYGNGVLTTPMGAERSMEALRKAVGTEHLNEKINASILKAIEESNNILPSHLKG